MSYETIETGGVPIRAWTRGVELEDAARRQLHNVAQLPILGGPIAVMPDVHWGLGATVGSVIPTVGAIVPAAVGVDIGCGMAAVRLDGARAADLPDGLGRLRAEIERAVPAGFGAHAPGDANARAAKPLADAIVPWLAERHPKLGGRRRQSLDLVALTQFGTLGGGNHFIELCLDEADALWLMLHSGSRGIGNEIGRYFIGEAREAMARRGIGLADADLAWLEEGTDAFDDYVRAVGWAQDYAAANRTEMLRRILIVLHRHLPPFRERTEVVNCHHNYVARETHGGRDVWLTRKGAVRAGRGELGIIPGSMGARSYIVRGRGNPDSYESCSHGAGRRLSRNEARRRFTLADHEAATAGIECRRDAGVLDETPGAYKDIDAVMAAQADLVEIVHTLRQVLCVKG